jgi:hypothetical protein
VGAGPNAATLHYDKNHRHVARDELVLVDAGAEWGGYTADITRTFPAGGVFGARQLDVYNAVLQVPAHLRSLLVTFGHFWSLLVSFGPFWPFNQFCTSFNRCSTNLNQCSTSPILHIFQQIFHVF